MRYWRHSLNSSDTTFVMHAQAPNIALRFGVVLCCAVLAVALYLPAEAKAVAFHDFYDSFIHPWGNTILTLIILALCVTSCVTVVAVLRCGSILQRIGVVFVLLLPAFIVGRFLFWIVQQWSVG